MRKSRFTEEQIINVLKEHAAGLSAGDLCRKHGISAATQFARTQAREMAAAGKIAARRHDQEHAVLGSRRRSARRKTDGGFFRRSGPGSAAGVTQINRATTDSARALSALCARCGSLRSSKIGGDRVGQQ
jgi:cell division septum initiation protein DivIVA